jgi:hypothetical protein
MKYLPNYKFFSRILPSLQHDDSWKKIPIELRYKITEKIAILNIEKNYIEYLKPSKQQDWAAADED